MNLAHWDRLHLLIAKSSSSRQSIPKLLAMSGASRIAPMNHPSSCLRAASCTQDGSTNSSHRPKLLSPLDQLRCRKKCPSTLLFPSVPVWLPSACRFRFSTRAKLLSHMGAPRSGGSSAASTCRRRGASRAPQAPKLRCIEVDGTSSFMVKGMMKRGQVKKPYGRMVHLLSLLIKPASKPVCDLRHKLNPGAIPNLSEDVLTMRRLANHPKVAMREGQTSHRRASCLDK